MNKQTFKNLVFIFSTVLMFGRCATTVELVPDHPDTTPPVVEVSAVVNGTNYISESTAEGVKFINIGSITYNQTMTIFVKATDTESGIKYLKSSGMLNFKCAVPQNPRECREYPLAPTEFNHANGLAANVFNLLGVCSFVLKPANEFFKICSVGTLDGNLGYFCSPDMSTTYTSTRGVCHAVGKIEVEQCINGNSIPVPAFTVILVQ